MTPIQNLSRVAPLVVILLLTASCDRPQVVRTGSQDMHPNEDTPPMFEYLRIFIDYKKEADTLNDLGGKGWELVAVHPLEQGAQAHPFYFKRKIQKAEQAAPSDGDKPSN